MKFKNYLNEKILHSDYTIGFEIEAISSNPLHKKYPDVIKSFSSINKMWSKGKIVDDETIIPDDDDSSEMPFEYVSPVIKFIPSTFKDLTTLFNSLYKHGIYTNETCGCHFHVAFPMITIEDAFWILVNLSFDKTMLKKMIKFKSYNFFDNAYAPVKFITKIRKLLEVYNTKEKLMQSTEGIEALEKWNELLGRNKMRFIRIHPQGTIEWRGPRSFMDNKKDIKDFLFLLWSFIDWITKTLAKKEINNIKRADFNLFLKKLETRSFKLDLSKYIKNYTVEKMVFDINKNDVFIWRSGSWYDGTWIDGVFRGGDWYDGDWIDGVWMNGKIMSQKFGMLIRSSVNPNIFGEMQWEYDDINSFKKDIMNKKNWKHLMED